MSRVIVAGSRDLWISMDQFEIMMSGVRVDLLVNGGCPTGIDAVARAWAKKHNVPIRIYKADWTKHAKAAGPIRNRQMAENADALIAIMKRGGSKGTLNMVEEARARNLRIKLYVI